MTEEPYRWLEAIANRREYVREQLKEGTPVFAVSRPEGILLLGVGMGRSKVFEIYDRQALAALGHPVDIEKLRQSAIEAAHLEGFNRSSADVTLRRLIAFSLSGALKTSFEQLFSPPFLVETLFAEVGRAPEEDVLARLSFDGQFRFLTGTKTAAVAWAPAKPFDEPAVAAWLATQAGDPALSTERAAGVCLAAWRALMGNRPLPEAVASEESSSVIEGKVVEAALLDRRASGPAHYRDLAL